MNAPQNGECLLTAYKIFPYTGVVTSRARLETDGAPNDGTFAPYRSPTIPPGRSQNFSNLAEVYNRQRELRQTELEQKLDEPIPTGPPPPDPIDTICWAWRLDGRIYEMGRAGRKPYFRKGPPTSGAARRLASLQKTGSEGL